MFQHVEFYAGDPILGLMDKYNQDTNPNKVNLGVGVYYDDAGILPVLPSVKTAKEKLMNPVQACGYLPMAGLVGYREACQRLMFGDNAQVIKDKRLATIATIGGSGALKVGAEFLHQWFPQAKCYVSDPTWGNHISIFQGAGVTVEKYPYYDNKTNSVKFDELVAKFKTLNENDIVLLHPCCHNPTGMDLTQEQWDVVLDVVKERKLIAFMDIAYQGFGDDMDSDAYAIRRAVDLGLNFVVSNSFSKNLSLYGERVGGLTFVCPNEEEAKLVFSQLCFTVRRIYSSPPAHGGYVVDTVVNTPELFAQWVNEVYEMRDRIRLMRQKLYDVLTAKVPGQDFSYLVQQRGMFSFTGLSAEQVLRLQKEYGIYMVENGRMSVAGLNSSNVEYVANAIADVLA